MIEIDPTSDQTELIRMARCNRPRERTMGDTIAKPAGPNHPGHRKCIGCLGNGQTTWIWTHNATQRYCKVCRARVRDQHTTELAI